MGWICYESDIICWAVWVMERALATISLKKALDHYGQTCWRGVAGKKVMCEAHLNSPASAEAGWAGKWAGAGHIPSAAVSASTCLSAGQICWRCIKRQPKCSRSQKSLPNMALTLPKEPSVVHVSAWGVVDGEITDHWGRKWEQLCLQQSCSDFTSFRSSFHPLDHQKWCVWIPLTALWWKFPEGVFCNIYDASIELSPSMERAQGVQHLESQKMWRSNHFRETVKKERTKEVLPNPHSGENCCTSFQLPSA